MFLTCNLYSDKTIGIISTIAGTGTYGYTGDGGLAINTKLAFPEGLCLDKSGNLYVVDRANDRIRKIDTSGIITTVAGRGAYTVSTGGYSGDGGPAINAELHAPFDIAIDGFGNIYFSDSGNYRVRKIDTNGIITTIAGTGIYGYSGDGGPAVNAQLSAGKIQIDSSSNIYISGDFVGNPNIRKIDPSGIITTYRSSITFSYISDNGDIYVRDGYHGQIMKIDIFNNKTIVAGNGKYYDVYSGDGGLATEAGCSPMGLTLDRYGNIYFCDSVSNRIRKIDTYGIISTIAGHWENSTSEGYSGDGGNALRAKLNQPEQIIVDTSGNLYFTEWHNHCIRKITFIVPQNDLGNAFVYPNPFISSRGDKKIVFKNITDCTFLQIFNIAGERVYKNEIDGYFEWECTNNSNEILSSGVYIYLLTNKTVGKKTGKIAIIR
jgi:sugar lactone lactonase YvrE